MPGILLLLACFASSQAAPAALKAQNDELRAHIAQLRAVVASASAGAVIATKALGYHMSQPVLLGDFDRVGYIRHKKAASTSALDVLNRALVHQDCNVAACLYSTGKNQFHCPPEQHAKYGCLHHTPTAIERRFANAKQAWGKFFPDRTRAVDRASLNNVVILRDPVPRILSDYFYTRNGNWKEGRYDLWIQRHPKAWEAIEANNYTKFLEADNEKLNSMTLQMSDESLLRATPAALGKAMRHLHACKVVLLAEYLPQGLMLLQHVFGLQLPEEERRRHARKSEENAEREAIEKDPQLVAHTRGVAWADQQLYDTGKRLFFASFKAYLQSKGEQVENIEEALETYR